MMKWVLAESDDHVVAALSELAGIHPLIARLMVNRGVSDPSTARSFLACDLSSLTKPDLFLHMNKAVHRIRKAVSAREKIVVYGDYDVDGVTGAAVLYLILGSLGANVHCYIPNRLTEGYGVNISALDNIKSDGAGLVITVDCGITAHKEATHARSLDLDVIVTDHHEFTHPDAGSLETGKETMLPDVYAVLHPALLSTNASSDEKNRVGVLTGVGVAFKLGQALLDVPAQDERLKQYLDLVALGTIADVGRITGENRILIKHGLDILSGGAPANRLGIAALKQVSCLEGKKIGVGNVGFTIAPRINASGRLSRADSAFRLLTTTSSEEAGELATTLDAVNRERQAVEEGITAQARQQCAEIDTRHAGALVLSSNEWHTGVIGIVASRIVEEFYRPTALISIKEGVGKGSARSIPGFNLYEGLTACQDLLLGFGGHKYAAGFTIREDCISAFRERLSAIVLERIGPQGFIRTLSVDGATNLGDLTLDLMQEIDKLAPFGQGNPEPRLGARDLEVLSTRIVGKNHLKLLLRQGTGPAFGAIAFKKGDLLDRQVRKGSRIAAVFTPRINTWNGNVSVDLEIRDLKNEKQP